MQAQLLCTCETRCPNRLRTASISLLLSPVSRSCKEFTMYYANVSRISEVCEHMLQAQSVLTGQPNTITIDTIASTWSNVHMTGIILRLVAGSMCMWCTVGEPENKTMTDQQGLQCGRGLLEDLQELVAQTCALFFGDRGIHSEQIQPLYKLHKNWRSYTVTYINLAHLLKQSTIL